MQGVMKRNANLVGLVKVKEDYGPFISKGTIGYLYVFENYAYSVSYKITYSGQETYGLFHNKKLKPAFTESFNEHFEVLMINSNILRLL